MSTITVVRKDGVAAIASDTMTSRNWSKETAEYVVNKRKILRVGESYLGITGPASAHLVLEHYFSNLEDAARFDSVSNIFETWMHLHSALKESYFLRPQEDESDAYESSRMDVLIANAHGIFGVEARRSVLEYSKFASCGSGDDFAMGAMYATYDNPEFSAEAIARLGVEAAAEFIMNTGVPILSHSVELKSP